MITIPVLLIVCFFLIRFVTLRARRLNRKSESRIFRGNIFKGNEVNARIKQEIWSKLRTHFRTSVFIKSLFEYYMNMDVSEWDFKKARQRNSERKAYKSVISIWELFNKF